MQTESILDGTVGTNLRLPHFYGINYVVFFELFAKCFG